LAGLLSTGVAPSLLGQDRIELPADDSVISVVSEDIFSVGSLYGDEWETFSRVGGVAFDAEGNLYVLDADNFRVVKVGPAGNLLAEMGGEGGGPGEFGMPFGIAVTSEGEVRVFDLGYGGFVIFGPDGAYSRSVPVADGTMIFPNGTLLVHPDGSVITAEGGTMSLQSGPDGRPRFPTTRPVDRYTLGAEVGRSVIYEGWNPATAEGAPDLRTTSGGGIQIQAPPMRAFDPDIMAGLFPDGRLVVMDSTDYRIKIMDPGSPPDTYLERPIEPREVTRRDREAERDRRRAEMEASGGPRIVMRTDDGSTGGIPSEQARAMIEARMEGIQFGSEVPVIAGMGVDWDGTIWVQRSGDEVGEQGPVDLIAMDGTYLGSVAPGEIRIPDAFGPDGMAAFIETDELDVPRVVVRRLSVR
jgi:hypothetical protein